jgi:endonuclease YncB( thermonuclease family)
LQTVYPAEVVRIIDGDTFQVRVQVWPGLSVDAKVRLRGIDAPELHARCADEYAKAQAARRVGNDPGGRRGHDFARRNRQIWRARRCFRRHPRHDAAALLNGGWARSYDGGRRGSWC